MRVIRRAAVQGHAIPERAGYARNPFPAEVMAQPQIVFDEPEPEPYAATAQNNYRGQVIYACNYCEALVPEDEVDGHVCVED